MSVVIAGQIRQALFNRFVTSPECPISTSADPKAKAIKTLDKDLSRITRLEQATAFTSRPPVGPGIAVLFMVLADLAAATMMGAAPGAWVVIIAAVCETAGALLVGGDVVSTVSRGIVAPEAVGQSLRSSCRR